MFALGTIINTLAIALAGLLGSWFGHLLKERHQSGLTMASGVAVLFLGISGSLEGLLTVVDGQITSQNSMLLVISLALGTLVGKYSISKVGLSNLVFGSVKNREIVKILSF